MLTVAKISLLYTCEASVFMIYLIRVQIVSVAVNGLRINYNKDEWTSIKTIILSPYYHNITAHDHNEIGNSLTDRLFC